MTTKKLSTLVIVLLMITSSVVAQRNNPTSIDSVTPSTPEWCLTKHYLITHYDENQYFGWTKQDLMIQRILNANDHRSSSKNIIDDVYSLNPALKTKDTIVLADMQNFISGLGPTISELSHHKSMKRLTRVADREYLREDRITKSFIRSFHDTCAMFDTVYTRYMKDKHTVINDSVLQKMFINDMVVLKPVIDSLSRECQKWSYDKCLLQPFMYKVSDFIFLMKGGIADRDVDSMWEDLCSIRSLLSGIFHNADSFLWNISTSDHKKPQF